ncbi:RNA-binding protein 42 [Selaginella moellendorffii]|uniref:RNA-binding protein 42 n=1 Tax=Selaginella moellendorffii TaxID=88036 RepID=UPI000D1CDB47|nr:RNA-binding protein 42 [Selaginella moellendorffii]|eukprot:XP_024544036.1 RNA-binding protein 42 [Selaginella moellendorffii]
MANLMSELERFEAEIKDLGSELTTPLSRSSPPRPPPMIGPSPSPPAPVQAPIGPTTRPIQIRPAPPPSSQFTYLSQPFSAPQVTPTFYTHVPFQPQYQQPPTSAVIQAPQYHYQGLYQGAPDLYNHPQQQQAQVLFQKDAQTINPEALENVKAALASGDNEQKSEAKKRAIPRKAAGQSWEDSTLGDWPENDFRLFCGDLGNEVNDEVLTKAFTRFPSFNMARVVRDKRTGKTKGYGFVSFSSAADLAFAMKEMNGKYVGNRPIKLRKSTWKERTDYEALEKQKSFKRPKIVKKNVLHK